LAEPCRGLREVEPVGIGRRSCEVIDLPSTKQRASHLPSPPGAVRVNDEGTLSSPDEDPNPAHASTSCVAAVYRLHPASPRWTNAGVPLVLQCRSSGSPAPHGTLSAWT